MENEADIEPVTVAHEEVKIDNVKDAIKNVIKKSMNVDGKCSNTHASLQGSIGLSSLGCGSERTLFELVCLALHSFRSHED